MRQLENSAKSYLYREEVQLTVLEKFLSSHCFLIDFFARKKLVPYDTIGEATPKAGPNDVLSYPSVLPEIYIFFFSEFIQVWSGLSLFSTTFVRKFYFNHYVRLFIDL